MHNPKAVTTPALLGSADIKKIAPVSDMSLWRWIKAGEFPQPIKIAKRNYWRSDEIAEWLKNKSEDRAA